MNDLAQIEGAGPVVQCREPLRLHFLVLDQMGLPLDMSVSQHLYGGRKRTSFAVAAEKGCCRGPQQLLTGADQLGLSQDTIVSQCLKGKRMARGVCSEGGLPKHLLEASFLCVLCCCGCTSTCWARCVCH